MGGGEEIAYGGKGKGVLIHTFTEGNGMPLANSTTPANGSEREQVIPLLDKVKLKTLKPGRPRKRVKVLAADKGYESKEKRAILRKRGIRPQIPKRVWKNRKNKGRPIKIAVTHDFNKNVALCRVNVNTVALRLDGNARVFILTHS